MLSHNGADAVKPDYIEGSVYVSIWVLSPGWKSALE